MKLTTLLEVIAPGIQALVRAPKRQARVGRQRSNRVGARSYVTLPALLGLVMVGPLAQADPLDVWHLRNPWPQGNTLYGVTWGNGLFVAVGDQGTVLTSTNGTNWTVGNLGDGTSLTGVTFGAGTFVAVGGAIVYTSVDGMNWTPRDPGPNDGMRAIAYGNGRFMAVGGGTLSRMNFATSTNLIDWFVSSTRLAYPHRAIAFGGGVFRVVTDGAEWGESTDGMSWLESGYGTLDQMLAVAYGNGAFVAAGTDGDVDGWSQRVGATNDLLGLTFAQGKFIAVGGGGIIAKSTNAVNWSIVTSGIDTTLRAVTFGNGLFVAVGDGGRIVTSPDGVNWIMRSRGPINPLRKLAYGNGLLVAVGDGGAVITSADDSQWTLQSSGTTASIMDICYSRARFAAVGNSSGGPVALSSGDGTNWTSTVFDPALSMGGITANSNIFVAVGSSYDPQAGSYTPLALSSTDGTNWSARNFGTNGQLAAVAYGGGSFVAVGADPFAGQGLVISSPDGTNWVVRLRVPAVGLNDVTYGSGRFVAIGWNSLVLLSLDGQSWQTSSAGIGENLAEIAYGNGVFVIRTYGQYIYTSSDGFTWLQKTSPLPLNEPRGMGFGQSSFFLVGALGAVFESDPLLALSVSFTNHGQLQLYGPIGRSCRIEAADSLGSAISWSPLATVLLTNAPQAWTDLRVPGARCFYRAVLLP